MIFVRDKDTMFDYITYIESAATTQRGHGLQISNIVQLSTPTEK